ncbi:hypothetical protein EJ03DRAFT_287193, partial [Teratosphaeria nubilosa]
MESLLLFAIYTSAALAAPAPAYEQKPRQQLQHANHIFNSVHSSMRQWGSSLNHNGMSIFIAEVPEDIEFYHGTSSPYRINGTEWLAFEPEHALMFARAFHGPPPGKGRQPTGGPDDGEHEHEERHGYLHTYRTKHPLRLLYVDGQSAAKSDVGTLDVQDMVLLHREPPTDDERRPHGPMSEGVRAQRLCRLAREQWNGRIDGIIRMEAGFEIILCDFEKHLDVVQVAQSKENGERGGPGGPGGRDSGEGLNSLKAVAARYDGIGGARVKVDYDSFVSLYAYDDAVVFDDAARPRVNNDTNVLEPVFSAVKDLVVKKPAVNGPKKDWQAIADMLVSRYANRIEYLASGDIDTLDAFKAETDRALRPFIDYSNRNATREVARCAAQFPPSATSDKLAAEAIHTVSSIICRTLSKAGEVGQLSHGLSMIRGLKSWLSWTEWKKCRGCAVNEVCVVPMWPSGTAEDFEHPQCRSEMSGGPGRGDGYW